MKETLASLQRIFPVRTASGLAAERPHVSRV